MRSASLLVREIATSHNLYRAALKKFIRRQSTAAVRNLRGCTRRLIIRLEIAKAVLGGRRGSKLLRRLSKQSRVLGAVRDIQIQIDQLKSHAREIPGPGALVRWLVRRRDALLEESNHWFRIKTIDARVDAMEQDLTRLPKTRTSRLRFDRRFANFVRLVRKCALANWPLGKANGESLHKARRNLKRYWLLQAVSPPLRRPLSVSAMKRVETVLGELGTIHDMDMLSMCITRAGRRRMLDGAQTAMLRAQVAKERADVRRSSELAGNTPLPEKHF